MKKSLAPGVLAPRKFTVAAPIVPTSPTMTLPDGTVLTKGMVVTVADTDGIFRFLYERLGEVTVFGGTGKGEHAYHGFRTFKPEQVVTATQNATSALLGAKAEAGRPAEWATMSAGQKAAHTKRMNLAAKAFPVSA